jgi:zinc D-Ala-D-Ala carboxypeptidase
VTNLSAHFTLAELTKGISATLTLNPDVLRHLAVTASGLERARAVLGVPIIVTSGFRTTAGNDAVGGSETSDHVNGLAADGVPVGMTVDAAFDKLMRHRDRLGEFDQVIAYATHLHFGFGARTRRSFYRDSGNGAVRVQLPPTSLAPADATATRTPPGAIPNGSTSSASGEIIGAIITALGTLFILWLTKSK